MARRFSAHSYRSDVFVAVFTAVFILSLQNLKDVSIVSSVNDTTSSSALVLPVTGGPTNQHALTPIDQGTPASRISKRIDLSSCPDHRLVVAARTPTNGMGHRFMQNFFVFWYAMVKGYCYCFDTEHFGYGLEAYHLLLEPVFPSCKTAFPNRTLHKTRFVYLRREKDVSELAKDKTVIRWVETSNGVVWPTEEQKNRPPGFGDLLSFIDGFLRDNHLVEQIIIPWYEQHTSIGTAFRNMTKAEHVKATKVDQDSRENNNFEGASNVLNAAFHLRVGDVVLEASESYWRNVLTTLMAIVDLERGPGRIVHVYWTYFQADHRGNKGGDAIRHRLDQNVVGEWPSEPDTLPSSHLFLAKLCEDFERIECSWKWSTNFLESIDLFVKSDIVYVSGSSFSQVLSLFNRGIRLVAITKELHIEGTATKGQIPFLSTGTNVFSSLRYYYIDGTGGLFDEHYVHLRLTPPKHTVTS
ncbi:hypothetical protein MHU86_8803 [Fragilaria crotonensis]|nr:hypothetical protein MHU86_8803 [Fragilaria crotonensis]